MKLMISLLLLLWTLGNEPMFGPHDVQQLCPVGAGVAVLPGAPRDCKLAAIRATQARIEQRMQRMDEHLQRIEREYSIP